MCPPLQAILPPLPGVRKRSAPVSRLEWESYRDFDGRISEENERKFRVRVFSGVSGRGRVGRVTHHPPTHVECVSDVL